MKRAFSIIEIIISSAVIAFTVAVIMGVLNIYLHLSSEVSIKTQAAILTEEAGEALVLMRDMSWESNIASLTLNTPYYLVWNGTSYVATLTPTLVGDFYRTLTLETVLRDGQDDIAISGTSDPNTRLATIRIFHNSTSSIPLLETPMLIHNTYEN